MRKDREYIAYDRHREVGADAATVGCDELVAAAAWLTESGGSCTTDTTQRIIHVIEHYP